MSTRARILIENNERNLNINDIIEPIEQTNLYIHSDGNPNHLFKWLEPFLKSEGAKARANHNNYLMAWICSHYCINEMAKYIFAFYEVQGIKNIDKFLNYYEPKGKDILKLKDFRGIGIDDYIGGFDIDYNYIITPIISNKQKLEEIGFKIYVCDTYFKIIEIKEVI